MTTNDDQAAKAAVDALLTLDGIEQWLATKADDAEVGICQHPGACLVARYLEEHGIEASVWPARAMQMKGSVYGNTWETTLPVELNDLAWLFDGLGDERDPINARQVRLALNALKAARS